MSMEMSRSLARELDGYALAIVQAGGDVISDVDSDGLKAQVIIYAIGPASVVRPFTTWLMTTIQAPQE